MNLKALGAILLIAVLTFAALTYGIPYLLTILNTGTVSSIYDLSAVPPAIDWGIVEIGKPINKTVNLTNVGTENITSLTMTYSNSSENLINYTLTWNCEGDPLPVGYCISVDFTLTIWQANSGPFSFDIYIEAT